MKKILLFLSVFFNFSARAQWVSIPDTNFGTWLNTNGYTSCIQGNNTTGWQLDTTCSQVQTEDTLICHAYIQNLWGVQFFRQLKYLDCSSNLLTSLPPLPSSLLYFSCSYNYSLKNISALPDSLQALFCAWDSLTALPPLPSSLIYLDCRGNDLHTLDSLPRGLRELYCYDMYHFTSIVSLPDSLRILDCHSDSLVSLPPLPARLTELRCDLNHVLVQLPVLPNGLKYLSFYFNLITGLPALPDSLVFLNCQGNLIGSIASMNNALTELYCDENLLHTLPPLSTSLQKLQCTRNLLDSLPALPPSLQDLHCSYNQLVTLPALPSGLTRLQCGDNLLVALPELPDSMTSLVFENNPNVKCIPRLGIVRTLAFVNTGITCLPNYPQLNNLSFPDFHAFPLCDTINPNPCAVTGISESANYHPQFEIYPSPAVSFVTIQKAGNLPLAIVFQLYDITGRMILQKPLTAQTNTVELSAVSKGMYLYNVTGEKARVGSGKLVVE